MPNFFYESTIKLILKNHFENLIMNFFEGASMKILPLSTKVLAFSIILIGFFAIIGCDLQSNRSSDRNNLSQFKNKTWVHSDPTKSTAEQLNKDGGECNMMAIKQFGITVETLVFSNNCLRSRGWIQKNP